MFDMSWGEVLVIGTVALVAIGPKDLPKALRMAGQAVGKVRRMAGDFQAQFNEAMREADLEELRKTATDINDAVAPFKSQFDPLKSANEQLQKAIGLPELPELSTIDSASPSSQAQTAPAVAPAKAAKAAGKTTKTKAAKAAAKQAATLPEARAVAPPSGRKNPAAAKVAPKKAAPEKSAPAKPKNDPVAKVAAKKAVKKPSTGEKA